MVKKLNMNKIIPIFVAGVMFCMPICANAATKTITLVMKENSKSISCKCPAAIIQGGAMIGGDGIDYSITFVADSKIYNVGRGYCKSDVSFKKINFVSPTGWSGTLQYKQSQHNLENPGIGWGRIDY